MIMKEMTGQYKKHSEHNQDSKFKKRKSQRTYFFKENSGYPWQYSSADAAESGYQSDSFTLVLTERLGG